MTRSRAEGLTENPESSSRRRPPVYGKDGHGRNEVWLTEQPDYLLLYRLARQICSGWGARLARCVDDFPLCETAYWDIEVGGTTITLHLEGMLGIQLYAQEAAGDELVYEIGRLLEPHVRPSRTRRIANMLLALPHLVGAIRTRSRLFPRESAGRSSGEGQH